MGTFAGHLFPGSVFIMFGLWLACNVLRSYFTCLQHVDVKQANVIDQLGFQINKAHHKPSIGLAIVSTHVQDVLNLTLPIL